MRTKLAAGNWKMNGTRAQAESLLQGLRSRLGDDLPCEVMVCPSFVYLQLAGDLLAGSGIGLGAQNLAVEDAGAYTGEVAGPMLADLGCHYVLVGHSERRSLFGEDNETVAKKYVAAQRAGLEPVLCVGETLEEREAGVTERVIDEQLRAVLALAGVDSLARAVIAYEPVWAIGTGRTATPDQAQAVHAFIRGLVAANDGIIADSVRILYGGSVKSSNAGDLFSMPDVDGGLVGGASLDAEDFAGICRAGGN
ncbi:MAG: triose-phosphate isomerase [Gammaproteobacteria bacterium]|jgi:triosephosphate isomerase